MSVNGPWRFDRGRVAAVAEPAAYPTLWRAGPPPPRRPHAAQWHALDPPHRRPLARSTGAVWPLADRVPPFHHVAPRRRLGTRPPAAAGPRRPRRLARLVGGCR